MYVYNKKKVKRYFNLKHFIKCNVEFRNSSHTCVGGWGGCLSMGSADMVQITPTIGP